MIEEHVRHTAAGEDWPAAFTGAGNGGAGGAWKLLVVDDEPDVHGVTRLVLADFAFEGKGLEFLHARSGAEATALFEQHADIAVALVDVVMESEHAGLELVRHVRETLGNRFVRIILRTGQPGAAPEREAIARYDINDYKSKAELSSLKLYSAMMVALRGYRDIMAIERQRRGLACMLEAAPALFGARSLPQFAEVAVERLLALLEADAGADACYAGASEDGSPTGAILAATGPHPESGEGLTKAAAQHFLPGIDSHAFRGTTLAVRLASRYDDAHVVCADIGREGDEMDGTLVELFRLTATSALDNLLLLEQNQTAQRQAIRALACLTPLRRERIYAPAGASVAGGETTMRRMAAFTGTSCTNEVEYMDFLKQLAIQAEVREWGTKDALRHVERIGRFAARLAYLADMSREFCEAIGRAAQLHDVGKIFAAPSGSTSWFESDADKRIRAGEHAILGGDFLQGMGSRSSRILRMAGDIALHHHEAWNGAGYPNGVRGNAIPLEARIVGLVVFFDTCTHPFRGEQREAADPAEAFDLVGAASGFYFDPVLARLFLGNRDDFVH